VLAINPGEVNKVETFNEAHTHSYRSSHVSIECRVEQLGWAVSSLETTAWTVDTSLCCSAMDMRGKRQIHTDGEKWRLMNKTISQTSFLPSLEQQHNQHKPA
jgi:hypothetical protein